jgi:hypothetical protein
LVFKVCLYCDKLQFFRFSSTLCPNYSSVSASSERIRWWKDEAECYTHLAEGERGGVKMRCYPMRRDHINKRYA